MELRYGLVRQLISLGIVALFLPVGAYAEDMARVTSLLGGMSTALREKSYQGLFTYEHGGALDTLKVSHRVDGGVEYASLEHLNGPPHNLSPDTRDTQCLSPADRILRGALPDGSVSVADLEQHYRFYIRDDQRIAGREATVVQAVPRDGYRYGHSFSIDKASSLPLGAMMFTHSKSVLERLQFVSLELFPEPLMQVENMESACEPEPQELRKKWNVGWMPSGFIASGQRFSAVAGDMLMFSDGLSSFSVFVRPTPDSVIPQGKAQRGATVAYMQQVLFNRQPYTVSVVGEVPARTAQRIATSVLPANIADSESS